MFIYVDESGTFVRSTIPNSWNVIAALAMPEATRRLVSELLRRLKVASSRSSAQEIKLKHVSEAQIRTFIDDLGRLNTTLYASCVDSGLQDPEAVPLHRSNQVEKIRENIPRMLYPEGRALIEDLASRVERLSDQLYTQMVAQIDLLDQVYRSATLYYAQRIPATLGNYRWRVDEKNSSRPAFEETMRHMAPPLLQAKSLREPTLFVREFDYSHFERSFRFAPGEMPTYLGLPEGSPESASNLGKILKDFEFVRSHDSDGVQVADLLASALRRVLRNKFEDNLHMALALGRLTVQRMKPNPSVHLISLSEEQRAHNDAAHVVRAIQRTAKPMFRR